jgi:exopolysaccharide/PEP-CTERM locus tyrosine autokinase
MERIKQALDKAREERLQQPATPVANTGRPMSVQQVQYTQTRTVKVPRNVLRESRIVTAIDDSAFSDAYKMLRTQVLQRLRENDWNVLAVTSPGAAEGKTLTAINLAASLAMEVDYTVLLVDANLRHPSIHEHLHLPQGKGLSEYLLDDEPVENLLIHPEGFDHLTILPGGRPLMNSSEMLNSPKMTRLVEEVKRRYPSRIVVFDLPPVLNAADALAFAPYVDAALLVVEEGKTRQQDLQRAVDLLNGTNVLGTVLNKAQMVN